MLHFQGRVRVMIDNGSNEDINKDDPAKQYDHLLKRYATLTSGDVMFIWKRASKITIIADKASLLTATNFNHDWYERPVTFSERVDQTDVAHFPLSQTEVIHLHEKSIDTQL